MTGLWVLKSSHTGTFDRQIFNCRDVILSLIDRDGAVGASVRSAHPPCLTLLVRPCLWVFGPMKVVRHALYDALPLSSDQVTCEPTQFRLIALSCADAAPSSPHRSRPCSAPSQWWIAPTDAGSSSSRTTTRSSSAFRRPPTSRVSRYGRACGSPLLPSFACVGCGMHVL